MKKILYIELCNFKDYPLGGHLSFALHLTTAMQGDIDLVGERTDFEMKEGEWTKCEIDGNTYNYYNVINRKKNFSRPLIPNRIKDYLLIKRHIGRILKDRDYDIFIIQSPEILLAFPEHLKSRVCLIMPGIENLVAYSRFKYLRIFATLYDKVFFKSAKKVNVILAASDSKAIDSFVRRSNGTVKAEIVHQFPTRYDASIFHVMNKEEVRKELHIPSDELMIITTGRLNEGKGWKYMIDSFAMMKEEHFNAKLYFLGKGEDEDRIRRYLIEKGLENSVLLAGVHPLSIVAKYLNAADLFIMGSYREGWSTSLVEAVACANPCVVTEFSSAHDMVKDGENGFVQIGRDEKEFFYLMEKALALDSKLIMNYAEKSKKLSVQQMRYQLNELLHFE